MKIFRIALLLVFSQLGGSLSFLFSSPDRVSFAKVDRPVEGVPVEAFELLNENLTVELWARSLVYSL